MGSPRSVIQGTVDEGRERELLDVTGKPRHSDTTQQGVAVAVSFVITRAPTHSVQPQGTELNGTGTQGTEHRMMGERHYMKIK